MKDLERSERPGEELNLDKLLPWMRQHWPNLSGNPTVTQFSGGASNWTYRLVFEDLDVILRRAPLGKKAKGAHNMPREFDFQRNLKPHYSHVPEMLAVCENQAVLGSQFYLMERIEGLILRKNLPAVISWEPEIVKQLCFSFWDKLIELHQIDYEKHGLGHLGKGDGYIERQITGWSKRYSDAVTWNVPKAKKVIHWLEQNMPKTERLCLIHNDFRLDNVVLKKDNPSEIIGVLDWELAGIGDPLMDLGNSMAYWVEDDENFFIKSIRRQPSNASGMLKRSEVIDYYLEKTGFEVDDFSFYRVYGLFRLAGIAQQIYYRYSKGYTKNKAFRNFWMISFYLIKTCENTINKRK